jgi:hypothetical protein
MGNTTYTVFMVDGTKDGPKTVTIPAIRFKEGLTEFEVIIRQGKKFEIAGITTFHLKNEEQAQVRLLLRRVEDV